MYLDMSIDGTNKMIQAIKSCISVLRNMLHYCDDKEKIESLIDDFLRILGSLNTRYVELVRLRQQEAKIKDEDVEENKKEQAKLIEKQNEDMKKCFKDIHENLNKLDDLYKKSDLDDQEENEYLLEFLIDLVIDVEKFSLDMFSQISAAVKIGQSGFTESVRSFIDKLDILQKKIIKKQNEIDNIVEENNNSESSNKVSSVKSKHPGFIDTSINKKPTPYN